MIRTFLVAATLAACAAPALADNYPVDGRFAVTTGSVQGPIDCSGKRVIAFSGNQRTDSNGGVPAYRNKTVRANGTTHWRIEDIFTTGQISNAHTTYTLHQVDDDHLVMNQQVGGTLKLQRCK